MVFIAEEQRAQVERTFRQLHSELCEAFADVELVYDPKFSGGFVHKAWERPNGSAGKMSSLRGQVFHKGGGNFTSSFGQVSDLMRRELFNMRDAQEFWASGVSVVVHSTSPLVPTVHMNVRCLSTEKTMWFGGGADMTPAIEFAEDTRDFHAHLQGVCDAYKAGGYAQFKKECDKYFYLPHRQEARGVGGVFYDFINSGDLERELGLARGVTKALTSVFTTIAKRRMCMPWGEQEKKAQLRKYGRYVEFNLMYDRGTKFGLLSGANPEGFMMSMPPVAEWD